MLRNAPCSKTPVLSGNVHKRGLPENHFNSFIILQQYNLTTRSPFYYIIIMLTLTGQQSVKHLIRRLRPLDRSELY